MHEGWQHTRSNAVLGFVSSSRVLIVTWKHEYDEWNHMDRRNICCEMYQQNQEPIYLYDQAFDEYTKETHKSPHVHHPDYNEVFETRLDQILNSAPQRFYDLWLAVQEGTAYETT